MTPTPAPAPTPSTGLQPNICGLLCWIPIGPVPLIASIIFLLVDPYKDNKFIRFHAFQNLFFAAASVGISIALMIIGAILSFAGPLVVLMIPLWLAYSVGILGVMIYMCIKAYGLESTRLPFIGELAAKQAGL